MKVVSKFFGELTTVELYELLKARAEIFVVEQNCVYQDLDDKDYRSLHVFYEEEKKVTAYLRAFVIEEGVVQMGRVLTREHGRGLGGKTFPDVVQSLLHRDPYMAMADFESYCRAHEKINELYGKQNVWNSMAITNTAMSGRFAADRAVKDYAETIWHCNPVK
jgi:ElaA protein